MEFKSEKFNNDIEKQKLWNAWSLKVDKITDGLGLSIDSGIKETAISFNVLGFKTNGSCEGHIDRGLPYPWVDFEFPPKEDLLKEFPNYEKDLEIIKEKEYKNLDVIKLENPDLHERILSVQNYTKKVSTETKNRISSLLSEFYSSNKPYSQEGKIELHDFRLELNSSRGLGLNNWKVFDEKMKRMSSEEKEQFLKNNQREMAAFTEFLKNKFFEQKQ